MADREAVSGIASCIGDGVDARWRALETGPSATTRALATSPARTRHRPEGGSC